MIFDRGDVDAIRNAVQGGTRVLVSSHIHPDPDAIGSVLAMREMLLQLGADPCVVMNDPVPVRCRILPGADEVVTYPQTPVAERFRVAVIVDAGGLSRIGDVVELLSPDALLINLDHHLSNDRFGAVNIVDLESAATSELLLLLCREFGLRVTRSLADNLFAGILTDTGRFRYPNTTARTLEVCSELMAAGAEITRITDALYYSVPAKDVLSLGSIYSSLQLFEDGRISTLFVRRENLVEDPDTIVDLALSIRGVEVAALMSETFEGKIRISLRAKHYVNVSRIAESLGGGGHEKAAGFRMRGTLESVRETILPILAAAVKAGPNDTAREA